MAVRSGPHPSEEILLAFGSGKLNETGLAAVVAHVESCPTCCQRAANLSGDSFLDRLRAAQVRSGTPAPFKPLAEADQGTKSPDATSIPSPALPAGQRAEGKPSANPTIDPKAPTWLQGVLPEMPNHPDYEVVRELGRGGMGVVFLVKNRRMDRLEVLKVINQKIIDSQGAAERFLREIRSAARLNHKNIVTAFAAPQVGEFLLFTMEYVPGEDLNKFVKDRGPLPVVNACYYAQQVAQGLQHANDKGLVHRDIKPQNLILSREGKSHVVKILDFGLAKATREKEGTDHGLTGTGMMLGTPQYMAPEQSRDAASADIRADIYSLGCTLYFLLTGKPPFQGDSLYELLNAHHVKEATPVTDTRPEVPAELVAVLARMMVKDPAGRYQKPAEVAQALAPFIKVGLKPPPLPPAIPVGTVIESNPTSARATKQTAAGAARQNDSLVNRPAGSPEAGWTLMADSTVPPKAGSSPPPVPTAEGTVMEGSATIARAQKKTGAEQAQQEKAGPAVQRTVIEGGPAVGKANKRASPIQARPAAARPAKKWSLRAGVGGAVLLAGAIGLVAAVSLLGRKDDEQPPVKRNVEPAAPQKEQQQTRRDIPKNDTAKKVTQENFEKLTVGMTLGQLQEILGVGRRGTTQDVDRAIQQFEPKIGGGLRTPGQSRRAAWFNAAIQERIQVWQEDEHRILAVFPGIPSADSKAEILLSSVRFFSDGRFSYDVAQKPADKWQLNFGAIKVGMTLKDLDEILGLSRRAVKEDINEHARIYGADFETTRAAAWTRAVKQKRVQVWQDDTQRIFAAFPGAPAAGSKVEVLLSSISTSEMDPRGGTYTSIKMAQMPADKWAANRENFSNLKVGMTLKEVEGILGMGTRITREQMVGLYWGRAPMGKLEPDEEARKASWEKAVREQRVHRWEAGRYADKDFNSFILAAFPETSSDDTKAEAFYYCWQRSGYEHKGAVSGTTKEVQPKTPDTKPADSQEVQHDEIKYDMNHLEEAFGLKFKVAKVQQGKSNDDTFITMTLEFTKTLPKITFSSPYRDQQGLRSLFSGRNSRDGTQLRCYFIDIDGVAFIKQPPGKIEGAVSGTEGDSFRITQTVPNAVLAKTKTISFREEPYTRLADTRPANTKPADGPEVKTHEIKYDMDHLEKAFGVKFKAAKVQQGKTNGDTFVTMTLEFTKTLPKITFSSPYRDQQGLRSLFSGRNSRDGTQLRCYFIDEDGVAFLKQPPGKIEGAVSGTEGDAFRITQTVPSAVLARTKTISFREEPFKR